MITIKKTIFALIAGVLVGCGLYHIKKVLDGASDDEDPEECNGCGCEGSCCECCDCGCDANVPIDTSCAALSDLCEQPGNVGEENDCSEKA